MPDFRQKINIRDFIIEDSEAVISLWHSCDLIRPWNDPQKDIQRKIDVLMKGGTGGFWVAETTDGVVGSVMAGYDGHRGSVNYLAVAPSSQQLGIGRKLMQKVEQELISAGCPKINLLVRRGNQTVLAFYERLGYVVDPVLALSHRLIDDQQDSK